MANRRRTTCVGLIGKLPPELHARLRNAFPLSDIELNDFIAAPSSLPSFILIIIGGGISISMLSPMLSSLRSAHPGMLIFSANWASSDDDQVSRENWADNHFLLPDANQDLFLAVTSAIAHSKRRPPYEFTKHLKAIAYPVVVLVTAWWLAVVVLQPPPYLLPSPDRVAKALWKQPETFGLHVAVTALEAFLGFAIGNVLGIALAILLNRYYRLRNLTLPALISFQAIPIVALAPLLIVWLGAGLASKVAMAAIICFFPMVVNAMQAFSTVNRDFVELFDFYQSGYTARLIYLLVPSSFSSIVAALKISAGLAVVGAIVAELTGADKGLGYVLLNSSYRLETDIMFVAMLLSALLGIVFYQGPALLRILVPRSWAS